MIVKSVYHLRVRNFEDFEKAVHRLNKILPKTIVWSVCDSDNELVFFEVVYHDYELPLIEKIIRKFH